VFALKGVFCLKKYNKYTKEFKLKAVKMYLDDGYSYPQVANRLQIRSNTQVRSWVKKFKEMGYTAFDEERRGTLKGSKRGRPKKNFSSLEEEVQSLRMEVEYLKKLKEVSGR